MRPGEIHEREAVVRRVNLLVALASASSDESVGRDLVGQAEHLVLANFAMTLEETRARMNGWRTSPVEEIRQLRQVKNLLRPLAQIGTSAPDAGADATSRGSDAGTSSPARAVGRRDAGPSRLAVAQQRGRRPRRRPSTGGAARSPSRSGPSSRRRRSTTTARDARHCFPTSDHPLTDALPAASAATSDDEPPWGADGRTPSFAFCPCCGVEWGYQDSSPAGLARFRDAWLAAGAPWRDPLVRPDELTTEAQLQRLAR